jgi:hypothetical protein
MHRPYVTEQAYIKTRSRTYLDLALFLPRVVKRLLVAGNPDFIVAGAAVDGAIILG